jgi:hypothetical protein
MLQQLQALQRRCGIFTELFETFDRVALLLDAQFHPANMHQRGIGIR